MWWRYVITSFIKLSKSFSLSVWFYFAFVEDFQPKIIRAVYLFIFRNDILLWCGHQSIFHSRWTANRFVIFMFCCFIRAEQCYVRVSRSLHNFVFSAIDFYFTSSSYQSALYFMELFPILLPTSHVFVGHINHWLFARRKYHNRNYFESFWIFLFT